MNDYLEATHRCVQKVRTEQCFVPANLYVTMLE